MGLKTQMNIGLLALDGVKVLGYTMCRRKQLKEVVKGDIMKKMILFVLCTLILAGASAPQFAFGQQNSEPAQGNQTENYIKIIDNPITQEFNIAYENKGGYKYKKETITIPYQSVIIAAHKQAKQKTAVKNVTNLRDVTDIISDVLQVEYAGVAVRYYIYDVVKVVPVGKGVQIQTTGQGVMVLLGNGMGADFGGTDYDSFQRGFEETTLSINGQDIIMPNLAFRVLQDRPNADKQLLELLEMKKEMQKTQDQIKALETEKQFYENLKKQVDPEIDSLKNQLPASGIR